MHKLETCYCGILVFLTHLPTYIHTYIQAIPYSWGWGLCGQLGQGDYPTAQFFPRIITRLAPSTADSITPGVKAISAGGIHSAAIDLQGR